MRGDQIFRLEAITREDEWLLDGPGTSFERIPCVGDPSHTIANRRVRPLRVVAPVSPLADFQWTPYGECIVNGRVREAFSKAAVTGVGFHPVETYTTSGNRFSTEELYELVITGWGGLAPAQSGIHVIKECPFCRRRVFSHFTDPHLIFNFDDWDGTDMFTVWPMPRFILMVGRVKDIVVRNRFSGLKICPIADLPINPLISTFTPGNISDWFEEKRAKELAQEVDRNLSKP